ncbi:MAG: DUF2484 family protein [Pseudomonadota bacterium]
MTGQAVPAVAACLWVLAAAGVALMPMRWQYQPGLALLVLVVPLTAWMAVAYGPWPPALFLLAFLSMFRRPLGALARWARGRWGQ